MFICSLLYHPGCFQVLPDHLPQYAITLSVQYPQVPELYHHGGINEIPDHLQRLFSAHAPHVNLRIELVAAGCE